MARNTVVLLNWVNNIYCVKALPEKQNNSAADSE
jgi:hypothetical protein